MPLNEKYEKELADIVLKMEQDGYSPEKITEVVSYYDKQYQPISEIENDISSREDFTGFGGTSRPDFGEYQKKYGLNKTQREHLAKLYPQQQKVEPLYTGPQADILNQPISEEDRKWAEAVKEQWRKEAHEKETKELERDFQYQQEQREKGFWGRAWDINPESKRFYDNLIQNQEAISEGYKNANNMYKKIENAYKVATKKKDKETLKKDLDKLAKHRDNLKDLFNFASRQMDTETFEKFADRKSDQDYIQSLYLFTRGAGEAATLGLGRLITPEMERLGLGEEMPSGFAERFERVVQPETYAQGTSEMLGGLAGNILAGGTIAPGISNIPYIRGISNDLIKQVVVRGSTALATTVPRTVTSVSVGDISAKDGAFNIMQSVGGSLVGVLPESIIPPGIGNVAGQVMTDLAYDYGTDKLFGRMGDMNFSEWFVQNMPNMGLSLSFAIRDFADTKGFKIQQEGMQKGYKDIYNHIKKKFGKQFKESLDTMENKIIIKDPDPLPEADQKVEPTQLDNKVQNRIDQDIKLFEERIASRKERGLDTSRQERILETLKTDPAKQYEIPLKKAQDRIKKLENFSEDEMKQFVIGSETPEQARQRYTEEAIKEVQEYTQIIEQLKLNQQTSTKTQQQEEVIGDKQQNRELMSQIRNEIKDKNIINLKRELGEKRTLSRTLDNGLQYILHASGKKEVDWQISTIGPDGKPSGDRTFNKLDEALNEFSSITGLNTRADIRPEAWIAPEMFEYIYQSKMRPVGPGSVPDKNFIRAEEGGKFGNAVFSKPLTQAELDKYDLEPIGNRLKPKTEQPAEPVKEEPVRQEETPVTIKSPERRTNEQNLQDAARRAVKAVEEKRKIEFGEGKAFALKEYKDGIDDGFDFDGKSESFKKGYQEGWQESNGPISKRVSDDIRAQVEPLLEQSNANIRVIHDLDDLPRDLKARLEDKPVKAAGFYDEDTETSYVIAGNLKKGVDPKIVVFHEVVGHHGIQKTFGPRLDTILEGVYSSKKLQSELAKVAKEQGITLNTKAEQRLAAEELIAKIAEGNPQSSSFKKLLAGVRTMLRKIGIVNYNESDLKEMVAKARENIQRKSITPDPTSKDTQKIKGKSRMASRMEGSWQYNKDAEKIRNLENSRYDVQKQDELAGKLESMTDTELKREQNKINWWKSNVGEGLGAEDDPMVNNAIMAGIILAERQRLNADVLRSTGDVEGAKQADDEFWVTIDSLMAQGTKLGQLINQFKRLKTTTPEILTEVQIRAINKDKKAKGKKEVKITSEQKQKMTEVNKKVLDTQRTVAQRVNRIRELSSALESLRKSQEDLKLMPAETPEQQMAKLEEELEAEYQTLAKERGMPVEAIKKTQEAEELKIQKLADFDAQKQKVRDLASEENVTAEQMKAEYEALIRESNEADEAVLAEKEIIRELGDRNLAKSYMTSAQLSLITLKSLEQNVYGNLSRMGIMGGANIAGGIMDAAFSAVTGTPRTKLQRVSPRYWVELLKGLWGAGKNIFRPTKDGLIKGEYTGREMRPFKDIGEAWSGKTKNLGLELSIQERIRAAAEGILGYPIAIGKGLGLGDIPVKQAEMKSLLHERAKLEGIKVGEVKTKAEALAEIQNLKGTTDRTGKKYKYFYKETPDGFDVRRSLTKAELKARREAPTLEEINKIMDESKEATYIQPNVFADIITSAGKLVRAATFRVGKTENPVWSEWINALTRLATTPFVQVPSNIAIEGTKMAFPELYVANGMRYMGQSTVNNSRLKKLKIEIDNLKTVPEGETEIQKEQRLEKLAEKRSDAEKLIDYSTEQRRMASNEFGRAIVGFTLNSWGAWLAANNLVSPEADKKDEAKRTMQYNSFTPQSLNYSGLMRKMNGEDPSYRDGDIKIPLYMLGYAGLVFNIHGNRAERLRNENKRVDIEMMKEQANLINNPGNTLDVLPAFLEMPFMKSMYEVGDFFRGLQLGRENNVNRLIKNKMMTYLSPAVPNNLNNFANMHFTYMPKFDSGDWGKDVLDIMAYRHYLLREKVNWAGKKLGYEQLVKEHQDVPMRYGLFGDPVKNNPEGPWSGDYYKQLYLTQIAGIKNDEAYQILSKFYKASGNNPDIIPTMPQMSVTYRGKSVKVPKEYQNELIKITGEYYRDVIMKYADTKKLSVRRLKDRWTDARARARRKFIREYKDNFKEWMALEEKPVWDKRVIINN